MRRAALLFVIAVCANAANAQFTLKPQAGFEFPSTKINYNDLGYVKPESQSSGQLGLRGDYQFKGGFGPFIGAVTHIPSVSYQFNDPMTGMNDFKTSQGNLQVQLQSGVQYSSKPISLGKKSSSSSKTGSETSNKAEYCVYSSCYKKYESKPCSSEKEEWSLRLQPSAGIGFIPSGKANLEQDNTGYTYNAGNNATEFIGGMAFEFSRNKKKFATLSVNYFKGLSDNETNFTTKLAGGKEETTVLKSKVSGWNASIGIPITFAKKPAAKKSSTAKKPSCQSRCHSYYRSRCGF